MANENHTFIVRKYGIIKCKQ